MKRIVVALAAMAGMLAASPVVAQQSRNMTSLPGDNTARSVAPAPPPERYVPPPIPPMPKLRPGYSAPSKVTVHRSTAKQVKKATKRSTVKATAARKSRHEATKKSVRLASKPSKHAASKPRHASSSKRSERTTAKTEKVFLSKKTIKQCHGMGYAQIMRNTHCRALMKQELAEADHKASAKTAKKSKAAAKSAKAKSAKSTQSKSAKSTKRSRHRR